MATSPRFERGTSSSAGKRSNPLSYEAISTTHKSYHALAIHASQTHGNCLHLEKKISGQVRRMHVPAPGHSATPAIPIILVVSLRFQRLTWYMLAPHAT